MIPRFLRFAALALVLAAAGPQSRATTAPTAPAVSTPPLNDTARWLAGMDEADAGATPLRNQLNSKWSDFVAQRTGPMREFAQRHLSREQQDCQTLFYPFSGPDALNAVTLFPNCARYVMFGLEPVGEMPRIAGRTDAQKAAVLADMARAQDFILRRNFFVTRYMQTELNTPHLKGVVPLMAAMLVRSGYELRDVQPLNVDGTPYDPRSPKAPRAVAVDFGRPGQATQRIFYANFDASDDGLKRKPGFLRYMADVQATVTLLKAASYLMHDPSFSMMRKLVEERSRVIVQDDSGLPFSQLKGAGFDVELYGNYVGVIPVFRYRFQRDLAQAYAQDAGREPLGFAWSYAPKPAEQALQIARRRFE